MATIETVLPKSRGCGGCPSGTVQSGPELTGTEQAAKADGSNAPARNSGPLTVRNLLKIKDYIIEQSDDRFLVYDTTGLCVADCSSQSKAVEFAQTAQNIQPVTRLVPIAETLDLPFVSGMPESKATTDNPKDIIGSTKPPLDLFSGPAAALIYNELCYIPVGPAVVLLSCALGDGAAKYGPFNWRELPVQGRTYTGAAKRHLEGWLDGQTDAEDSGIHHLAHAAAGLFIVLDAELNGTLIDNRSKTGKVEALLEDCPFPSLLPVSARMHGSAIRDEILQWEDGFQGLGSEHPLVWAICRILLLLTAELTGRLQDDRVKTGLVAKVLAENTRTS